MEQLDPQEQEVASYYWHLWARDNQLAPTKEQWWNLDTTQKLIKEWYDDPENKGQTFTESWRTWLLLAGRGNGKTRAGAEWIREQKEAGVMRMALVAPTAADVRDVMVEGESGLLARCPPWDMPTYVSSKRKVIWDNGAQATMYSAEEARRLRGPQHEKAWCDELTSWQDPGTWDMLQLGLRLGTQPQVFVTTTSSIGHRLLKNIIKDPFTVRTKGHTFENAANLSKQFIQHIKKIYEGTRLGKQELEGEYLDEGTGVLWNEENIVHIKAPQNDINRVVVSVDPSITTTAEGAETGLIVCGRDDKLNGYVMADHSGHYSPSGWAQRAIDLFKSYKANYIVAETNNGGDMVIATIQNLDPSIPVKKVVATRGKRTRAEPVSMLYEQGRVFHIGTHHKLEEQMIDFNPDDLKIANDRVDAMVWGFTELIIEHSDVRIRHL
jgi:phage terminase large subunit-like protein